MAKLRVLLARLGGCVFLAVNQHAGGLRTRPADATQTTRPARRRAAATAPRRTGAARHAAGLLSSDAVPVVVHGSLIGSGERRWLNGCHDTSS